MMPFTREESMDETQSLQTIAQLAIGLAGFTGLVSAVQSGAHKSSREATLKVRQLLETSLGVAFYAFLPILIIPIVAAPDIAWRLSNAILALAHIITLAISISRANQLGGAVVGKSGPLLHLLRIGGFFTIVLNVFAALNIVPWHSTTYLIGLLYLLLIAAHTFIKLLLTDDSDREKSQSVK